VVNHRTTSLNLFSTVAKLPYLLYGGLAQGFQPLVVMLPSHAPTVAREQFNVILRTANQLTNVRALLNALAFASARCPKTAVPLGFLPFSPSQPLR